MGRWIFILMTGVILFIFSSCEKKKEVDSNTETEISLGGVREEGMENEKTKEAKYVEGEVLVKFKPEISNEEIVKIIKEEYKCEILDVIEGLEVYRLKIPQGKKVIEMIEEMKKDTRIKYVEPNLIYRLQL